MTLCVVDRTEKGIVRILADRLVAIESPYGTKFIEYNKISTFKIPGREGKNVHVITSGNLNAISVVEQTMEAYGPHICADRMPEILEEIGRKIEGSSIRVILDGLVWDTDYLEYASVVPIGHGSEIFIPIIRADKDKTVKECFIETLRSSNELSDDYDEIIIEADHGLEETCRTNQRHSVISYFESGKRRMAVGLKGSITPAGHFHVFCFAVSKTAKIVAFIKSLKIKRLIELEPIHLDEWERMDFGLIYLIDSEGKHIAIKRDGGIDYDVLAVNTNMVIWDKIASAGVNSSVLKLICHRNPKAVTGKEIISKYLKVTNTSDRVMFDYDLTDLSKPPLIIKASE